MVRIHRYLDLHRGCESLQLVVKVRELTADRYISMGHLHACSARVARLLRSGGPVGTYNWKRRFGTSQRVTLWDRVELEEKSYSCIFSFEDKKLSLVALSLQRNLYLQLTNIPPLSSTSSRPTLRSLTWRAAFFSPTGRLDWKSTNRLVLPVLAGGVARVRLYFHKQQQRKQGRSLLHA
jgi:hypothetical protein